MNSIDINRHKTWHPPKPISWQGQAPVSMPLRLLKSHCSMIQRCRPPIYRGVAPCGYQASPARTVYLILISTLVLLCLFPVLPAYADGGAPNLAYVAGGSNGISIIDISQQKVTGSIALSDDPHMVYLSLDGRFLYVTQPALGHVVMISAQTKQPLCTASVPGNPTLLAFDLGTNTLYAAGNGAASISALNSTNCSVKFTIQTQGPVYGLAVAQLGLSGANGGTGNQLWATDSTSLLIFDSAGKQLARVPIPGGPRYLSIPTGVTAYVTTASGEVYAIDLATRKVSPPLIRGGSYGPMDYDAFTDEVYVPDRLHDQIVVLSPVTSASEPLPREPERTIPLGVVPESIAITSDGQLGFVALQGGNVAMLDIPGRQLINTIHVGGNPQFIITGLFPPLLGSTPQSASFFGTAANILGFAFLVILILVPIFLLRRQRSKPPSESSKGTPLQDGHNTSGSAIHRDPGASDKG